MAVNRVASPDRTNTMNPLRWRHEHQVALLLGAVLGIAMGLLVWFLHNGVQYATLRETIWTWSTFRWGVFGALIGAAIVYVRQLLHT